MQLDEAVAHYERVVAQVRAAVSSAAPVGQFTPDGGYTISRTPCEGEPGRAKAWTQIYRATSTDPAGDAFWDRTWPAVQRSAEAAGFGAFQVLDDRRGNHAVEFADDLGAVLTLMATPTVDDPSATWTSLVIWTGCHEVSAG